jgi:hypothetical protein
MYPGTFFGFSQPFPRSTRVFVAMSFDSKFDYRWEEVLRPAVQETDFEGAVLEPHRVDLRNAGDSILTEILDEISQCRLFIADVSVVGTLDGRPIRNANVFYEAGLAHAVRLPEEIIMLRDDGAELPFDIANVRVHHYDPDSHPAEARKKVKALLSDALREVNLRRNLSIGRAVGGVDYTALMILSEASHSEGMPHPMRPDQRTRFGLVGIVPRLFAIERLVLMGALESRFLEVTPALLTDEGDDPPAENLTSYHLTEFGDALYVRCGAELGIRRDVEGTSEDD